MTTRYIREDKLQEAAHWFIRLSEPDCTDAERAAFARWIDVDPAHDAAYQQVDIGWKRTGVLADDPQMTRVVRYAANEVAPHPPQLQPQSLHPPRTARRSAAGRGRRWPRLALAAMVGAVLVTGLVRLAPLLAYQHHETGVGGQRQVTLGDGTHLTLDSDTSLRVRYSPWRRRVILDRGQAQFRTGSDPHRPFVVSVDGSQVRAIGTTFQVRATTPVTTVTLLEGALMVDPPPELARRHAATMVLPGEQVQFNRNRQEWTKGEADIEAATGWLDGYIVAWDWRLDTFVAEMNRHLVSPKLRVGDASIADMTINGGFRPEDVDVALQVLERSHPLRFERIGNEIVVRRR